MVRKNSKRKFKREPFGEKVLNFLGRKAVEIFDLGATIMFDPKKLIGTYGFTLYGDSYNYPREFSNLKKSPYFRSQGNKFYLTEKGRIKIIKNIIRQKPDKKKWGGKWLAVAFDIPETTRRDRNFLRRELKWMGLIEFQHSIWVTPWDMEKEILALLELWRKDFRGDIRFLKVDRITNDKELKESFGI